MIFVAIMLSVFLLCSFGESPFDLYFENCEKLLNENKDGEKN